MTYNYKKCHHLHVGKNYQNTEYTMDGPVMIAKVDSEKDLGVIFDSNMKFGEHINSKVTKANQILGLIFRTLTYMDKEMFLNLFKSLIRSHLEYATVVWSPLYKKDMIQIENRVPTIFCNWGNIWSYSIFLYPQCIAAYREPHHFWGYKPNFGGKKPSAEGKWECWRMYNAEQHGLLLVCNTFPILIVSEVLFFQHWNIVETGPI